MSNIRKIIPLVILIALILMTFTSFSRMIPTVQNVRVSGEVRLVSLDRVEYVPNYEKKIDAPYLNQLEKYPNGCEAVSAVMALNHLGIAISVDDFIDGYLDMGDTPKPSENTGPDPDRVYCGDPRSDDGWGCNSPVIVNALNKLIDKDKYVIEHSYGKSLQDLCYDHVDRDIPVMVWVTVDMEDSSDISSYRYWKTAEGKEIAYNCRLHCMLLCGYDDENYYFNDPMTEKLKAYPKADTEKAYEILGMQSIVIIRNYRN